MTPKLRSVGGDLPDPPYPAGTSAGAKPFHLDVQRMLASDTWLVLSPEARPWALLSWVRSWSQNPCGTLPGNLEMVQARLDCPDHVWKVHHEEIMRGWVLHSDKKFYHKVVTEKVLQMIADREKWSLRQSKKRENLNAVSSKNNGLSPMSRGSHGGVTGESRYGYGIGTGIGKKKKSGKKEKFELPDNVDRDAWEAWYEYRRSAPWPWTHRAKTIAASRLADHDADTQRRAVDKAIELGYRGVFFEKLEVSNGSSRRVSRKSSAERVRDATAQWYAEQVGSEPPTEDCGPVGEDG